jgi:ribose transport system ATP-binding protein
MLLLEMSQVSKSYSGQQVLHQVNLQVRAGEIHALVGENGAGKTTIVKLLLGLEKPDAGEIRLEGRELNGFPWQKRKSEGIVGIFQEVNLLPNLDILENVYMGFMAYKRNPLSPIRWSHVRRNVDRILDRLPIQVDATAKVSSLTLLQMKLVEVAQALCLGARVIILDEATADLDEADMAVFTETLKQLRQSGLAILFISHKLNEVMKLADRISIIRKGSIIAHGRVNSYSIRSLIDVLSGHTVTKPYPKIEISRFGEEVLRVENLNSGNVLRNINFTVRRKEIVGLTGFADSGKSEVARAIFGLDRECEGKIYVNRNKLPLHSPLESVQHRISYIPSDRNESLVNQMDVHQNISLSNLKTLTRMGFIDSALEKRVTEDYIRQLNIRTVHSGQSVQTLSSGNRQKVMIAKSLLMQAKICIMDEPTKGLDITSKVELYNLMNEMVLEGGAILIISSDLEELLGMCDRVLVLYRGEIVKELRRPNLNERDIIYFASGEK